MYPPPKKNKINENPGDYRTATCGSSNPQKKLWIELLRLAVLIVLFRTANSVSCSLVFGLATAVSPAPSLAVTLNGVLMS